jgi:hypothetical protein
MIVFSLVGLVLIGGLAFMCFTKAFSIVFLGNPRSVVKEDYAETGFWQLLPLYEIVLLMFTIGLFPFFFINALERPVNLFTHHIVFNLTLIKVGAIDSLQIINRVFIGFAAMVLAIFWLRKVVSRNKVIASGATWGCGYSTSGSKLQYTANSFVRSYSKLAKPVLEIEKNEVEVAEVFPGKKHYETDPYDKLEGTMIDKPLKLISKLMDMFVFLQNGHLQRYILYGIIFITAVICVPLIVDKIITVLHFLNNL